MVIRAKVNCRPTPPLPRRMWAGGSLAFIDKLRIGDKVSRISEITSIKERTGKSGALVFVQVSHRLTIARGPLLEEMQDIVNREPPADVAASEMPPGLEPMQFREGYGADSILLFRYSALTFNRHRIHYDEPYATGVEGYDGLVVQGPLQGISRLPEVAGDKPAKQPFKRYPIGYFHIDIAKVRTEEGKLYLFVAIDRTSKFAFARLMQNGAVVK